MTVPPESNGAQGMAWLFDYNGVLVADASVDVTSLAARCGLSDIAWQSVIHEVDEAGLWSEVECGRLTLDAFATLLVELVRRAGGACDLQVGRALWWGGDELPRARAANRELLNYVASCRGRVLLGIATNNFREHRPLWERTVPIDHFDRVFDSSEMGVRKPHPAFFAHIEAAFELPAVALALVDDVEANVDAARRRGWTGILYREPSTCVQVLKQMGEKRCGWT